MAAKSEVTQNGEGTLYPTDELRRMDEAVTFRQGLDDPDELRTSTPVDDAELQLYLARKQAHEIVFAPLTTTLGSTHTKSPSDLQR